MRKTVRALLLIAAISGLTTAAHAQTIAVVEDNFYWDTNPYGGVAWNFAGGAGNTGVVITNDNLLPGTNTQNLAFTFDTTSNVTLNFGLRTEYLMATGNTNTLLQNYSLEFDMAVQGVSLNALGGFVGPTIAVFGNGGGLYNGDGAYTNPPVGFFPAAGAGYQHYSIPLTGFATHVTLLPPTDANLAFCIGFYMAGLTNTGSEEIDIANLRITMLTNPPPPPPPTNNIVLAKPGLRVFTQDFTATYNQEGFGTVDSGQSWAGATPSAPVSYSITFEDFNTVNGYTLYAQFVPNAANGDPYAVYNGPHAFVWSITHQNSGFTTSVDWKTNAPQGGQGNNALRLTSTSSNGVGTWTLTFTNATNGKVTAPDGTNGTFSLPPDMAAYFVDPLRIDFGTAPNSTGGYGQYIDIGRIAITNVAGVNEYDDFTTNATLDTTLWNPGFSLNAGSVVQVATNTPFWVTWTVPSLGFVLETKADVTKTNIPWHTLGYYSGGVTNIPRRMGPSLNWVLVPSACLPTVDGTTNGTPSTKAFFRMANPGPAE